MKSDVGNLGYACSFFLVYFLKFLIKFLPYFLFYNANRFLFYFYFLTTKQKLKWNVLMSVLIILGTNY